VDNLHLPIAKLFQNLVVAYTAETMFERFFDRRGGGQRDPDPVAGDKLYFVDCDEICRVRHGHGESGSKKFYRNQLMLLDQLRRDEAKDRILDF
jgi:hypothetical protein